MDRITNLNVSNRKLESPLQNWEIELLEII